MSFFCQSLFLYLLLLPLDSLAGEFLTDTPVPLNYGEVKMDAFSSVRKRDTSSTFRAPGFEADIGLYPDLQSHFVVHATSVIKPNKSTQYGWGDTELCLKYRFIHETDIVPQVAFYPRVTVPSTDTSRGIGAKKAI